MKKRLLTTIVIIPILFFVFIQPQLVNAQDKKATCTGVTGFVNWKTCLGGSDSNINNKAYFYNDAYTQYYNDLLLSSTIDDTNKTQSLQHWEELALNKTIQRLVTDVIALMFTILIIIYIFQIFRSRIIYISAGDNEEKVKQSSKILKSSITGSLIVLLGFLVLEMAAVILQLGNIWEFRLFG